MKKQPHESLDNMLLTEAIQRGYHLDWWGPEPRKRDPTILTLNKEEIYRWERTPLMVEVWEQIAKHES